MKYRIIKKSDTHYEVQYRSTVIPFMLYLWNDAWPRPFATRYEADQFLSRQRAYRNLGTVVCEDEF